jgi:hypothetical protein
VIEPEAAKAGIPVDTRIGRGRTVRHALRGLMETERFDRIVVTVATDSADGFSAEDIAWLLDNAQARWSCCGLVKPMSDCVEDLLPLRGQRLHLSPSARPRSGDLAVEAVEVELERLQLEHRRRGVELAAAEGGLRDQLSQLGGVGDRG